MLAISLAAAMLPGFAASLGGLTGKKLGAGKAIVAACDTNGFAASYTTSAGNVTSVILGGIADPGCEGGQLSLQLANSGGTSVGASGPTLVPTDGGTVDNSMTMALSPTPAVSVVTAIHVVVTGP
jgi:hypothetical protein